MQPEDHNSYTRQGIEIALELQDHRARHRGREAEDQKDRRQPHDEENRRHDSRVAPPVPGRKIGQCGAAHIGQIGRHDGQHAGAQKRNDPGRQCDKHGGEEGGVDEVNSEHGERHTVFARRRHETSGHKFVDRMSRSG